MKKITLLPVIALLGITIFTFTACQSTKSATTTKMLRFNFENGKGYDYEMNMEMDMGSQMKMDMLNYYSMDVTADDGATKTITTRIDRVKMKMNMAGMDITVDSDAKGSGDEASPVAILNKIFGAITGRQFIMKVNAEGRVQEVSGFTEMAAAMADSMGLEGEDRKKMMAAFNESFNEKGMKSQFERVLYIFPNKEVKVGDTWDRETVVAGQMAGSYKSTYIVKEIEGDMVTLEEKTKIEGDAGKADTMSGNVSGLLVVDSKTGLVVNADQDVTLKMEKDGQKITINSKNKIKGKAR
jgi:Family of unknown function (DUF6263)